MVFHECHQVCEFRALVPQLVPDPTCRKSFRGLICSKRDTRLVDRREDPREETRAVALAAVALAARALSSAMRLAGVLLLLLVSAFAVIDWEASNNADPRSWSADNAERWGWWSLQDPTRPLQSLV